MRLRTFINKVTALTSKKPQIAPTSNPRALFAVLITGKVKNLSIKPIITLSKTDATINITITLIKFAFA